MNKTMYFWKCNRKKICDHKKRQKKFSDEIKVISLHLKVYKNLCQYIP